MTKDSKLVPFEKFATCKNTSPELANEIKSLIESGRAHWFEFSIDKHGDGFVRMTKIGKEEFELESRIHSQIGNA